jgi:hypothetical protein
MCDIDSILVSAVINNTKSDDVLLSSLHLAPSCSGFHTVKGGSSYANKAFVVIPNHIFILNYV